MFFPGFPSFWSSCSKGASFYAISRCHLCQNLAPFDTARFSHHFFHFAADFVTLPYTKMAIFSTLKYTASLRHSFRAKPPRIAHCRECPQAPEEGTYDIDKELFEEGRELEQFYGELEQQK